MNAATVEQLEAEVSATCTRLQVLMVAQVVLQEVGTAEEVASIQGRIDALVDDLLALRASLAAVQHQDQINQEALRDEERDDHDQGACWPECRLCRSDEP